MDIIEEYYGKQTFVLYSLFTKVPGKKAWPRKIFLLLSILMLSWGVIVQLLKIVESKFKREVIIELLPTAAATSGTLVYIPYISLATTEDYKVLLSIIITDLREERTDEENEIKKRYANEAKVFINTYMLIFALAMCGMPLTGFLPCFLDILMPLNETREKHLFVNGEFLVDEKRYFYYVYIAECFVVLVVCVVIGVSENMGVIFGQHVCGMSAVLGHRLENLTHLEDRKFLDRDDYMDSLTSKLHRCIEEHKRFLRYAFLMAAFYDVPLTFILTGSFTTLTLSLVQVTDPELTNFTIISFTITQIFQLFILSYVGQKIIDASEKIAVDAYNTNWYICSPSMRRLLQLLMLRSSKPCIIVARSIYVLSLENFMSVMQTVTSCYMVLRQTQ